MMCSTNRYNQDRVVAEEEEEEVSNIPPMTMDLISVAWDKVTVEKTVATSTIMLTPRIQIRINLPLQRRYYSIYTRNNVHDKEKSSSLDI